MAAAASVFGGLIGFHAALIGVVLFSLEPLPALALWLGTGIAVTLALIGIGLGMRRLRLARSARPARTIRKMSQANAI